MMRLIFALIFVCNVAFGQSSVPYPLSLVRGGSGIDNTVTVVGTSGRQDNLSVTTSVIKFTGNTTQISGLAANGTARRVILINRITGGGRLELLHDSSFSTSTNRFTLSGNTSQFVNFEQAIEAIYDTHSSRWRVADFALTATSPLTISSGGALSIPAVSSSVNGYLTSTQFNTFTNGLLWTKTGNDIYNNNTNNVWITLYPCVDLTTYAACIAKTQCTAAASGNCSDYNGNQSACEGQGQCSWSDPDCTGNYFVSGDCSGSYNADDGTSSKLQVKSTVQCSGSASSCASLVGTEVGCNAQLDCSYTASNCIDYTNDVDCNDNNCTWQAAYCSGDNSQPNTCPNYDNDQATCEGAGCTYNDVSCSSYDGDQSTCDSLSPDCIWYGDDSTCRVACQGDNATGNTCPDYNEDSTTCTASGCTYVDAVCGGSNASCSGTARACSSFTSSGSCVTQAGCNYSATPAGRFQGDLIATSDGYLKFEKTAAGAPSNTDCNADDERGRMVIDTTNNRLYICNGASRGWDYTALTN